MLQLVSQGEQVVMNTYSRFPVAVDHGEGVYLWDIEGKKYLDFVAGIAVNCLGYNHKGLVEAIADQAGKLLHCSNLYYSAPQVELASLLVRHSDFDKVFFCNSGAEANEAALKLMRKYAQMKKKAGSGIITMIQSFHGRTYGAITATGQEKYQKGLDPLLPGFTYVPYNDFEALQNAVDNNTCGILMEVIQGEGGVVPAEREYLQQIRKLCDEKDILLIFDEVQTGVGRSGSLFAYQEYGVVPDGATFAKGLAGGVPIGALMVKDEAAKAFAPGDHASTFGGNALATQAGQAVLTELFENGVLENVKRQGEYLKKKLLELKEEIPAIETVRGMGLMQGIVLSKPVGPVIAACIEKGLLLVGAGPNVIRFVPPLIIKEEHIDEMCSILKQALEEAL